MGKNGQSCCSQESCRQITPAMITICPQPSHWASIYQRLNDLAIKSENFIPSPPKPLILSGWDYSNDVEKRERWLETLDWGEKWGFTEVLREITPDMMYEVENPSTYQIGPMGGPMHLDWNFEPAAFTSKEEADQALLILKSDWEKIVGRELFEITEPIRFTGSKMRRLLICADPSHKPLWGSWTELSNGPERREFTALRSSINRAINPMMIDHIDFVHTKPGS